VSDWLSEAQREAEAIDIDLGPEAQGDYVPPEAVAPSSNSGAAHVETLEELTIVPLGAFVAVEEEGASALVGTADAALIPEGGDVMFYGDGGAGKTSLAIDLACHLAAGSAWLGMPVTRPVRVLLVENEGPRPLFRAKLRRKVEGWHGSELGDRVQILETPWARITFADEAHRQAIAANVAVLEVDVLIAGPVTNLGMNEAGTLQEVRDFMRLVAALRQLTGRPLTVVLVHHENKGGQVSGAWEGSGDTLLHVQGQGHGRTRVRVQKARWASVYHATTLNLAWAEGEGFEVEEKPELDDNTLADQMLAYIGENAGTSWTNVEKATPGVSRQRRRDVRDRLLAGGRIVNVVKEAGQEVAIDHCPERKTSRLYLAGDPSISHLRPASGADEAQTAPARGAEGQLHLRPAPRPIRGAGVGAADSHPSMKGSSGGEPPRVLHRLPEGS
jgi:AAA domain